MKHVFGPVPSRRLGFSLGVDLVVPKTCTLDCIYCELGPTTDRTVTRRPYVPVDGILEELRARLAEHPDIDFITLSGSGEPTLNSDIGGLIEGIKAMTDVPVAVLTNGTLLTDPDVRAALAGADVVDPLGGRGLARGVRQRQSPARISRPGRNRRGARRFRPRIPR